jgi:hypothetical protein
MKKLSVLTSQRVEALFRDSLCREEETHQGIPLVPTMKALGLTIKVEFNKVRLDSHREEVKAMLNELPIEFKSVWNGGKGGQSFIKLCVTKEGIRWTNNHRALEQLCLLAIGLDLGCFPFPRQTWSRFPNGIPDFCIS